MATYLPIQYIEGCGKGVDGNDDAKQKLGAFLHYKYEGVDCCVEVECTNEVGELGPENNALKCDYYGHGMPGVCETMDDVSYNIVSHYLNTIMGCPF